MTNNMTSWAFKIRLTAEKRKTKTLFESLYEETYLWHIVVKIIVSLS